MEVISGNSEPEEEDVIIEGLICGECGYSTLSEVDLNQHKVSQHVFKAMFGFIEENLSPVIKTRSGSVKKRPRKSKGGKLKCDECDYSSENKQLLKNHVASVHKNIRHYRCSLCDYKSFYNQSVKFHIDSKHKDINGKILNIGCEKCQRDEIHEKCDEANQAKKRQRKLKGGKLKCDECDYSTENKL